MRARGRAYTHAPKALIKKYTGQEFSNEEYETEIGDYILQIAGRVMHSEWEILRITERLRGLADALEAVIMTPPGRKPPEILESIMHDRQVDLLLAEIARRGERIRHMKELATEYREGIHGRGTADGG